MLGRYDAAIRAEVRADVRLFAGIVADAAGQKGIEQPENLRRAGRGCSRPVPDPNYTIRAWRAVVTYLLRRPRIPLRVDAP